jgi:catechol 2,3-dioxygenase-like lactoylglutathione lyase family enzyme
MRFAHARIVTNDVPSLTRFYKDVIGLTPAGDDRYVEFYAPELTLAISSQNMIDLHSAGATTPKTNRSVILDFEVQNVDQEWARLRDIIDEFVLEPTTQPWGNRAMQFRDPDGNLINMFAVPAASTKP